MQTATEKRLTCTGLFLSSYLFNALAVNLMFPTLLVDYCGGLLSIRNRLLTIKTPIYKPHVVRHSIIAVSGEISVPKSLDIRASLV